MVAFGRLHLISKNYDPRPTPRGSKAPLKILRKIEILGLWLSRQDASNKAKKASSLLVKQVHGRMFLKISKILHLAIILVPHVQTLWHLEYKWRFVKGTKVILWSMSISPTATTKLLKNWFFMKSKYRDLNHFTQFALNPPVMIRFTSNLF